MTSTIADDVDGTRVTVYSRPGCPYCSVLRAGLQRAGLPFDEVDIWRDPDAAAVVRRHADGNETVPTVEIGALALVNPSASAVLAEAARAGIDVGPPSMPSGSVAAARHRFLRDDRG